MSIEIKKEIQLEIAHVLFIDIVGYSKLSINDQCSTIDELTQAVRTSEQVQNAEAAAARRSSERRAAQLTSGSTGDCPQQNAARHKDAHVLLVV